MSPSLVRAAAVATALTVTGGATLAAQDASAGRGAVPAIIVVSGRAESAVPADRATVTISVETHAAAAVEAGAENARVLERVRTALQQAGVAASDITTAGYAVTPEYRFDQGTRSPTPTGYAARNAVRLELSKPDQVGRMIDVALGAGANRVDGVQFSARSIADARKTALTEAVANARTDALTIARAAGGTLGPLLEVSTERYEQGPGVAGGMAARLDVAAVQSIMPFGTPIDARTVRVTATVLTRWVLSTTP